MVFFVTVGSIGVFSLALFKNVRSETGRGAHPQRRPQITPERRLHACNWKATGKHGFWGGADNRTGPIKQKSKQ
jgi:hypothetical protein